MILTGLKVAVDVQHIYRDGAHAKDRGTIFALATGGKVAEADCALHYAQTMAGTLRDLGATVLSNQPRTGILVGPYSRRTQSANALGANLYLACHINAGRGSYAAAEYIDGTPGQLAARMIVDELQHSLAQIHDTRVVALREGERGVVCVRGFTGGPAVILEPLFGDTLSHQALLSLKGLESVGQAIARGVVAWWNRTTPARPPA